EAEAVFQAGDDDALDAGKRRGTPLGAMRATVVAGRRQAANVTLATVVIRRHLRVVEKSEQFAAVLEQPPPDAPAVRMLAAAVHHQVVVAIQNRLAGAVEGPRAHRGAVLAQ